MVLGAAIVVSAVIALLRGGQFTALTKIPLRWGALALAAFAVQAMFIYGTASVQASSVWGWRELLFVGSHALLLLVVWANRHLAGVKWIGLGLLLNLVVMVANGGWMPVRPEAIVKAGYANLAPSLASGTRVHSSKNIVLPAEETKLWFLSDVFVLARPFPVPSVFSIGDVLIASGVFLLIQHAMLGRRRESGSPNHVQGVRK